MNESFNKGFIEEAIKVGCTVGEAIDLLKFAINFTAPQPSFNMGQSNPPNPPINPLVNTQKPTNNFAAPNNSGFSGMQFPEMPGTGTQSNITTAAPDWASGNGGQQVGQMQSTIKI